MTADERRIANANVGAGPWANHDDIVIRVAVELSVESHVVETVLQRLRMRQVLNCVSTSQVDEGEGAVLVRYEKGMAWTEEE